MKIYTKTGDNGTTALIGGKRVPKNHLRIEAYGTVDELISFIGVVRDYPLQKNNVENLILIQDQLMVCAAILSTDSKSTFVKIPQLTDQSIVWLEQEMDKMDAMLPPLENFVLPGGHPAVSFCHVARTICRRAERIIITLTENYDIPEVVLRYINRLSDYLFVLSRALSTEFQAVEIQWRPMLDK